MKRHIAILMYSSGIHSTTMDVVEEINAEDDVETFESEVESTQSGLLAQGSTFLSNYGWCILLGILCIYIIWAKWLRQMFYTWKQKYEDRVASAKYHKDPDLVLARLQAMEKSRRKMQEDYDKASAQYVEKLKEKEELKRQEKIEEWERHEKGLGYHNKSKASQEPEAVAKRSPRAQQRIRSSRTTDCNPLSNSGGSTYRPSRRE